MPSHSLWCHCNKISKHIFLWLISTVLTGKLLSDECIKTSLQMKERNLFYIYCHAVSIFMMTSWHGNIFQINGPLWIQFLCHWWIPLTKNSNRECSLCCHCCYHIFHVFWTVEYWKLYHTLFPCKLTHWGQDKMDAILQTTFSSAFSWMKMFEFRLKFHWSLFLRVQLSIFQHWFR